MCNSESIEQEIKKIVSNVTANIIEKVADESKIIFDLGADSLDMIEIVMEIESTYEIDFDDEVFEKYGDEIRVSDLVCETESAIKGNVNNE